MTTTDQYTPSVDDVRSAYRIPEIVKPVRWPGESQGDFLMRRDRENREAAALSAAAYDRMIEAVRAAEREKCAQIAEEFERVASKKAVCDAAGIIAARIREGR